MILNYEAKEHKMIDVFVRDMDGLRSYLVSAKSVKAEYEDLRFSITESTPKGSVEKECCIPAKRVEEFHREQRKELFEDFYH